MRAFELKPRFENCRSYYRKAQVIEEENVTMLRSYDTIVCTIDNDKRTCNVRGRYSNTTARHIREFLRQWGLFDKLPNGKVQAIYFNY